MKYALIVYRNWSSGTREIRDGWFLFGIIPLYIRRVCPDTPTNRA